MKTFHKDFKMFKLLPEEGLKVLGWCHKSSFHVRTKQDDDDDDDDELIAKNIIIIIVNIIILYITS